LFVAALALFSVPRPSSCSDISPTTHLQVRVWDVTSGSCALVLSHENAVCCCCWGPGFNSSSLPNNSGSRFIASGDQDSLAVVWNADTCAPSVAFVSCIFAANVLRAAHQVCRSSGLPLDRLQCSVLCTYLRALCLQLGAVMAASKFGTRPLVWLWLRS